VVEFPRGSWPEATLLLVLADAALRPGEAFTLRWDDVSLVDRILRVERECLSTEPAGLEPATC
jgi:integrase